MVRNQICFDASDLCNALSYSPQNGPEQNVLAPVKGQGINAVKFLDWLKEFGLAQKDKALFALLLIHISGAV